MTNYPPPEYRPPPPVTPAYVYPQTPYQPPVNRHEGLAITALVLGVVGCLFGLIPLTFWIALPCGVFAVVFGFIGHRPKKGKAGIILGTIAIILGIIGVVIINNAVNNLSTTLGTPPTSSPVVTSDAWVTFGADLDGSGISTYLTTLMSDAAGGDTLALQTDADMLSTDVEMLRTADGPPTTAAQHHWQAFLDDMDTAATDMIAGDYDGASLHLNDGTTHLQAVTALIPN